MKNLKIISGLFVLSGIYDAGLGFGFLFFARKIFELANVTQPNHMAYVMFPAGIMITFGIMFFAIARNPETNRNLIPYGILLKVSYAGTVFYYWFTSGIPIIWKPFAILDILFLIAFIAAFRLLLKQKV